MLRMHALISLGFLISACSQPTIIHPERKNIVETVYASGKIISENEYAVYALANGTITAKLVKEGDTVSKGMVLYEIKNEASFARLEAAKANFENAKSNLSPESGVLNELKIAMHNADVKLKNDSLQYLRYKNLLEENATSKINVDNALMNYTLSLNQKKSAEAKYRTVLNDLKVAFENAKSQLAAAENELNNYLIKSEADGMVFQLPKEKGETVRAGEMIALLGSSSQRIIKLMVDQQDIDKIMPGQAVLLKTDVTGNEIYHAAVSRVFPVMNEPDQTYRVDAVFKDTLPQRFIHNSVEANIIIQEKNNALVIPFNAVLAGDSVLIRNGKKIKQIAIKTGIHSLEKIEVLNGLDENTEVVIARQK